MTTSSDYNELILGAGSTTEKRITIPGEEAFRNPTTLDINPTHNPDVLHDLNLHPLPFDDNSFDEIHAYEVLEHLSFQGDYEFFFAEFTEYHRILKPEGKMFITLPAWNSPWAWGDPSHTRVLPPEVFTFLVQQAYADQVGITAMSDFRHIYKADFGILHATMEDGITYIVLQGKKFNI